MTNGGFSFSGLEKGSDDVTGGFSGRFYVRPEDTKNFGLNQTRVLHLDQCRWTVKSVKF